VARVEVLGNVPHSNAPTMNWEATAASSATERRVEVLRKRLFAQPLRLFCLGLFERRVEVLRKRLFERSIPSHFELDLSIP